MSGCAKAENEPKLWDGKGTGEEEGDVEEGCRQLVGGHEGWLGECCAYVVSNWNAEKGSGVPQHVVISQWVTFQCQRSQRHELLIELFPSDKGNFQVELDLLGNH